MLGRFFKKKSKKVVVLGLDGVPCSLLNRFADEGIMPNMARLRQEGTLCSMTASIPEVSSTSWSTFMTGVNPGRHGIYGFIEVDRNNYSWRFPNFNDLKSRTIWEIAGDNGKRSIVVNIPSTYPARPLNGMLVSGFVALDLRNASYPDAMYRYLSRIGYRLDVNAGKAVESVDEFTNDIIRTFRKRVEAINYLYDSEEWDLFIAAITETDRLHHYLWAALDDTSHPQHEFLISFYQELDRFIGSFYEKIDSGMPFIMLSDHGFTAIKKEVYLNVYLKEKGYLSFNKKEPESFEALDSGSKAFVLDPSRVYIHLKDKFSRGCVDRENYEDLRNAIREDLLLLQIDGERVIRDVFFKEEIYNGKCLPEAPDLIVLPTEGYDLKGSIRKNELIGRGGPFTGGHTRDNAVFYINRPAGCDAPDIVDAGVTVLKLLDINTDGLGGNPLV